MELRGRAHHAHRLHRPHRRQTTTGSIARTFDANRAAFPAGARSSDPIEGHFISRAIDDSAWWGLTWLAAYDLTDDRRYLDEAVTIAAYVHQYWDTGTCGGGVWWDRERTYKNAVTNGLYLRLADGPAPADLRRHGLAASGRPRPRTGTGQRPDQLRRAWSTTA